MSAICAVSTTRGKRIVLCQRRPGRRTQQRLLRSNLRSAEGAPAAPPAAAEDADKDEDEDEDEDDDEAMRKARFASAVKPPADGEARKAYAEANGDLSYFGHWMDVDTGALRTGQGVGHGVFDAFHANEGSPLKPCGKNYGVKDVWTPEAQDEWEAALATARAVVENEGG
jgi:hypothetical protein